MDSVEPSAFGYVSNKPHALRNHTVLTTLRLRSPSPRTKILNFSTPSAANWLKDSVSPISFQTLKRKTASSALPNSPPHTACIARTTVAANSRWQRGVSRIEGALTPDTRPLPSQQAADAHPTDPLELPGRLSDESRPAPCHHGRRPGSDHKSRHHAPCELRPR